jgi:UDP-glucose:(heptosyl)LPS alpha-1,3-glucosyltransferase
MPELAFILYKYFPFGGLQRDFLRIALECQRRGAAIRVYTLSWQGELPTGFTRVIPPARVTRACSRHARNEKFHRWLAEELAARPVDRVIGFNKMPGLDVYYAADPCYEDKARSRWPLYRLSGRYRHFHAAEQAVFAPQAKTRILLISALQQPLFTRYYGTPVGRFVLLPPGIARDRQRPAAAEAAAMRNALRAEFAMKPDEWLLVQIGSGFKTKGLDRTLAALAALPEVVRKRTRLIAIGQDNPAPFLKLARRLGLGGQFLALAGRDDIPRFLQGADLLLHPAYFENTGTVLLEALVAGLPVITTAACGYAHYIEEAGAGVVLPAPFLQAALNETLSIWLQEATRRELASAKALRFAQAADIYDLPVRAADAVLEGLATDLY